jgi:hypothetical protein
MLYQNSKATSQPRRTEFSVTTLSKPQKPHIRYLHISTSRVTYNLYSDWKMHLLLKVQLSANIHMSDFCWLLFLDTNTSLEQFFTDINIPFDCQFLVAQPQVDHVVVLTEVYHVSPTFPLQTYHFGNWTSGGGLTWPTQGLYSRRNNLQGLVLKTGTTDVSMWLL